MQIPREIQEAAPKYRRIGDWLLRQIATGELPDGANLPSEEKLAAQFQVGRTTVRQALRQVRELGHLESFQGRRSVVRRFPKARLRRLIWLGNGSPAELEPMLQITYNNFMQVADVNRVNVCYWMLNDENVEKYFPRRLRQIDGMIFADTGRQLLTPPVVAKLKRMKNCVTLFERSDSNFGTIVRNDEFASGRLAAEALVRRGYRRILMLAVSTGFYLTPFHLRVEGFLQGIATAGLPEVRVELLISNQEKDFEDARPVLERCGALAGQWDAIFCITDFYALKCMEALKRAGMKIPEQLGVIGIDGLAAGETSIPRLTTVRMDAKAMAEAAFAILSGTRPAVNTACLPELIERDSLRQLK